MINRFSHSNKNTVEYHQEQAFSIYNSAQSPAMVRNRLRSLINRSFFATRQWIFEDDIELFLKDESGNIRNRIRFVHNMVKPVVRQFIGNAIRTSFDYSVIATSPQAHTRMDAKLQELLGITEMQKALPNFAEALRKKYPIGQTKEETAKMFGVTYKDELATGLNYLINSVQDANKFELIKITAAENLALDGIGTVFEEEVNQEQVLSCIRLKDFIFDTSAQMADLSDSMYKGHMNLYTTPSLAERYNVAKDKMALIEARVQSNGLMAIQARQNYDGYVGLYSFSEQSNKVPVCKLYWDDISLKTYGCFLDMYGYEVIHEVEKDENSLYHPSKAVVATQKELVDFFKGELFYKHMTSETRFCDFIPASFMATSKFDNKSSNVLVLDYGVLPFSNIDSIYKTKPYFPYATFCWKYDGGEILSPVDDIIDPQRYYNRIMSVAENQVNNSRLSGSVIDKNAVDNQSGGEEELVRNMATGKPIFVDAPDGIHNAVGNYSSNVGDGAINLHNIGKQVKSDTLEGVGVNENMFGTGGGYRVSNGVVQSNIQQGTLMQEDFYFALNSILSDATNSILKRGRMIYIANNKKLSVRVGDNFARVIELSKDCATEEFRLSLKRTQNVSDLYQAGENRCVFYLQNGLIDKPLFAKLFGNSTPSEVDYAMRKYQQELAEATRQQSQMQSAALADRERAQLLSDEAAKQQQAIEASAKIDAKSKEADAKLITALSSAEQNYVEQ